MSERLGERYFVIGEDEQGGFEFVTHGYFTTRQAAESYARAVPPQRKAIVVQATSDFYKKESGGACGG